jgi:hypothetical protein
MSARGSSFVEEMSATPLVVRQNRKRLLVRRSLISWRVQTRRFETQRTGSPHTSATLVPWTSKRSCETG